MMSNKLKQTFNLRQAGNRYCTGHSTSLHSPYKTFAQSHPYSGGTISWFLVKPPWPSPTLEAQTVSFQINPYAGGTNSCFLKASLR